MAYLDHETKPYLLLWEAMVSVEIFPEPYLETLIDAQIISLQETPWLSREVSLPNICKLPMKHHSTDLRTNWQPAERNWSTPT